MFEEEKKLYSPATVTYTFDMTDPDVRFKHRCVEKAEDLYFSLWEFSQDVLRHNRKYREDLTDKQYELNDEIEEKFYAILEEHGVNLFNECP